MPRRPLSLAHPRLGRGVYEEPYLSTADETVLVAIDHRGRRIGERIVSADANIDAAWAGLEAFLEHEDPPAFSRPALVRAG